MCNVTVAQDLEGISLSDQSSAHTPEQRRAEQQMTAHHTKVKLTSCNQGKEDNYKRKLHYIKQHLEEIQLRVEKHGCASNPAVQLIHQTEPSNYKLQAIHHCKKQEEYMQLWFEALQDSIRKQA